MNRIEYTLLAGILAASIGLAPIGPAAAADTKKQTRTVTAKSPAANAPLLGRIVVRPGSAQRAKLRRERRNVTALENRARADQQASRAHTATIGAL